MVAISWRMASFRLSPGLETGCWSEGWVSGVWPAEEDEAVPPLFWSMELASCSGVISPRTSWSISSGGTEATAQATDLVLMTKPAYAGKVPLFLGINNVKFRKKILPGDTLEIHAEMLTERADKAIATCKCTVYTAGDLAAESEVTIAMR